MSNTYEDIFENPQDNDPTATFAPIEGGSVIVSTWGDEKIAQQYVPKARALLGSLQYTMYTSKVVTAQRSYLADSFEDTANLTIMGVTVKQVSEVTVRINLTATNGYGTFPDTGRIEIIVDKEGLPEKSTQCESLGYIVQFFNDVEIKDNQYKRPYFDVILPSGVHLTNWQGWLTIPDEVLNTFSGYPDFGAKWIPGPTNGYEYPNHQEVFIRNYAENVNYTWPGPQTAIPDPPAEKPPLLPGWEWVTIVTYAEGTCGAELSDWWGETTYYMTGEVGSGGLKPANQIYVNEYDSIYGLHWDAECGQYSGFGTFYSGPHTIDHISGTTAGCKRLLGDSLDDGSTIDDKGIFADQAAAGFGYEQAGPCVGALEGLLSSAYEEVKALNPDRKDEWYLYLWSSNNTIRRDDDKGFILQMGWQFTTDGSGKIMVTAPHTGDGETSIFMIGDAGENLRYFLSDEVREDALLGTDPRHYEFTICTGGLNHGRGWWGSSSTQNKNQIVDITYDLNVSDPFGLPVFVEHGVHQVFKMEDSIGKAKCWILVRLRDDEEIREQFVVITHEDIGLDSQINILVGEFLIEQMGSLAWKVAQE